MSEKDLKINFRYLIGNIACMSVNSVSGKPVHNDINNEEAIIIFNSLVGEKDNCQTVKTLLKENQQSKEEIEKLNSIIDKQDRDIVTLSKGNKQLKEQNEFLIKRENKLQQIEMMFKNRNVDLEELSNLILDKVV